MKQEIINQLNQLAKENEPFLFVINYEGTEAYIRKLSEIDPAACLYDFEGVSNAGTMASQPLPSSILWDVEAPLYEDYEKSFEVVERHIKAGDTHLVNLTSPVAVRCNLSLEEIFLHTQGKYKLMLKNGDQGFVCFSPETFVRINEGRIYSYPMKGTIDATLPNAEQIIMADEKEAAEHVSVVELISEDLSRVSSDVRVDRYRYVDRLHTNKGDILQTSSEVSGLCLGSTRDGSCWQLGVDDLAQTARVVGRIHHGCSQGKDRGGHPRCRALRPGLLYGHHGHLRPWQP